MHSKNLRFRDLSHRRLTFEDQFRSLCHMYAAHSYNKRKTKARIQGVNGIDTINDFLPISVKNFVAVHMGLPGQVFYIAENEAYKRAKDKIQAHVTMIADCNTKQATIEVMMEYYKKILSRQAISDIWIEVCNEMMPD